MFYFLPIPGIGQHWIIGGEGQTDPYVDGLYDIFQGLGAIPSAKWKTSSFQGFIFFAEKASRLFP